MNETLDLGSLHVGKLQYALLTVCNALVTAYLELSQMLAKRAVDKSRAVNSLWRLLPGISMRCNFDSSLILSRRRRST